VGPDQWDHNKGSVRGKSSYAHQQNSNLDSIQNSIFNKKKEMEDRDLAVTAQSLRNFYLGTDENNKTILDVFRQHYEQCRNLINGDFAPGTYDRYETCFRHISDFMAVRYIRKDMNLKEISPQFIRDFEYYLNHHGKSSKGIYSHTFRYRKFEFNINLM
jgi:hypothetical protein